MDEEELHLMGKLSQTDDPYGACILDPDGGGDTTYYHDEESVLVSVCLSFHFSFI